MLSVMNRFLMLALIALFAGSIAMGCSEEKTHDLAMAVSSNDFQRARELIRAGADVNCRQGVNDETMLMLLASTTDRPAVEFLLENKADVGLRNSLGMTALMYAAMNGRAEMVHLLVAAGCDVNADTGSGQTAISVAKARGHQQVVAALLASGAADRPPKDLDRPMGIPKSGTNVGP